MQDPSAIHVNFFNNDITRLDGLGKWPRLMRLTLRKNNLTTLQGIEQAPALQWLDASTNDLNMKPHEVHAATLVSCAACRTSNAHVHAVHHAVHHAGNSIRMLMCMSAC